MTQQYDLIIIGGGIVGAAAAYRAVRRGARTLLLDRRDPGRATHAGAGILAPPVSNHRSPIWFDFAVEAVDYYPLLVGQLAEDAAGETGYARCGMLNVAATEDELDAFATAEANIFARQQARGAPSSDALHRVTPAEAKALFPPLAHVHAALYYRDACRVDGRLLTDAMTRAAAGRGLTVENRSAERLILEAGRMQGVEAGGEEIHAGAVIIAGGAWSPAFGRQLGVAINVEPQRGQIIHWDLSPQEAEAWPIVGAFRGHYMLTFPGGRVVTGATRETGSGYAPTTSAAGIREVIDEALRVAPGLAQARLLEVRVGLRPFTHDGLPVLGSVPGTENVILATGHGPSGLQLGPYSGLIAAEMALGDESPADIAPFSVTRFG
ncbi:MAG: FAD-binding oxidoreductase [Caldilineaceae bacterium]|nr:FAD-binding oxidoreductase [Caldilineaceae bacterium]